MTSPRRLAGETVPNIGPAEILVILVVALLVFGPDKLPEIGRQVGRAVREFRRVQATLREEVRDVLEPPEEAARPPRLPPLPVETGTEPDGDDDLGRSDPPAETPAG